MAASCQKEAVGTGPGTLWCSYLHAAQGESSVFLPRLKVRRKSLAFPAFCRQISSSFHRLPQRSADRCTSSATTT